MGKKRLEPYANGMAMKIDNFGHVPLLSINGGNTITKTIPLMYTNTDAEPHVLTL